MSITNRITGDQKISGFVNIYNQNNENIENALKEYKDDYKKLDSEIKGKFDNELKRIKNNLTSDVVNLNQNINKFEEKIEKISEGFQSKVEGKINSVVDDFRKDYKNDIDNIKVEIQSDILSSVNEDLQKCSGQNCAIEMNARDTTELLRNQAKYNKAMLDYINNKVTEERQEKERKLAEDKRAKAELKGTDGVFGTSETFNTWYDF